MTKADCKVFSQVIGELSNFPKTQVNKRREQNTVRLQFCQMCLGFSN